MPSKGFLIGVCLEGRDAGTRIPRNQDQVAAWQKEEQEAALRSAILKQERKTTEEDERTTERQQNDSFARYVGGNYSVWAEWTEEQGPWLCRVKLLSLCD